MVRLRSIPRLLRSFAQIERRRRWLFAEAAVRILVARLAVLLLSFPRLAQRLGILVPAADPRIGLTRSASSKPREKSIARDISWAVTRAAHHLPFGASCLTQAIAAQGMLKRRGIPSVMHFGAGKGQTRPLDAHAWLDAAGVNVTGYPVADHLAEIACFVCLSNFQPTKMNLLHH
jgi:hypothetical protein